jgi:hypothetical protein
VGLVLLGLAALGCGAGSWAPPEVPGAGAPAMPEQRLLPVEALGEDVLMRQRVTIQWNGREADFDAVLQKRGAQLLLLGLGPMDRVGFRLVLEDGRVEFENRTGRELPFDPDRILLDVQRVFYPWLERDAGCGSCDRHGSRDGIEITERIEAGRLEERRFRVPDRVDVADVVVRYEDWMEDGLAPRRAVLANGWRGYALRVETSSAERLE